MPGIAECASVVMSEWISYIFRWREFLPQFQVLIWSWWSNCTSKLELTSLFRSEFTPLPRDALSCQGCWRADKPLFCHFRPPDNPHHRAPNNLPILLSQFLSYLRHRGLTSEILPQTTLLKIRTVSASQDLRLWTRPIPKGNFPFSRDDSKVLAAETGNMPKYK